VVGGRNHLVFQSLLDTFKYTPDKGILEGTSSQFPVIYYRYRGTVKGDKFIVDGFSSDVEFDNRSFYSEVFKKLIADEKKKLRPFNEPQLSIEAIRDMRTKEVGAHIKRALRVRSGGVSFSVKKGTGTAGGWLHIALPNDVSNEFIDPTSDRDGYEVTPKNFEAFKMHMRAKVMLAALLDLDHPTGDQQVAASSDYYIEYVDRAEGRPPRKIGEPYWD